MENLQLISFNMESKTVWIQLHESERTVFLASRFNQETESKGFIDKTNEAGAFEIPVKKQ